MLGGVGNNYGIILGTGIFIIIRTFLVVAKPFLTFLPFDPVWFEYTLAGTVLVIIVLFKPSGLIPEKPETSMSTERIREIVERIKTKDEAQEEVPSQPTSPAEESVTDTQSTEEISTQKEPPDENT